MGQRGKMADSPIAFGDAGRGSMFFTVAIGS
jgi:hypothetical protein